MKSIATVAFLLLVGCIITLSGPKKLNIFGESDTYELSPAVLSVGLNDGKEMKLGNYFCAMAYFWITSVF
jgi:hypothetical protein